MSTESTLIARVVTEGAKKASDELKDFTKTAKEAQSGVGGFLGAIGKAPGALKLLAVGAGAAMVIKQLSQAALEAAQRFDDLSDRADRLGISFQELQVIESVFERAGVSADQASEMIMGFDKAVNMAITSGKGPMAKTLKAMSSQVNLLASDFAGLSGKEGLQLFIQKMQEAGIEERQQKAYLEQLLPGSSKLHAVLKDNADEFERMGAAMREAQENFGLNDEDVQNFKDLEAAASDFGVTWNALADKFLAKVSPMTEAMIFAAKKAAEALGSKFLTDDTTKFIKGLEEEIANLDKTISGLKWQAFDEKQKGNLKESENIQKAIINLTNAKTDAEKRYAIATGFSAKQAIEEIKQRKQGVDEQIKTLESRIPALKKLLTVSMDLSIGKIDLKKIQALDADFRDEVMARLQGGLTNEERKEFASAVVETQSAIKFAESHLNNLLNKKKLADTEIAGVKKTQAEDELKKAEQLEKDRQIAQAKILNDILLDEETQYWQKYIEINENGLDEKEVKQKLSDLDFQEEMVELHDKLLNSTDLTFSQINAIIDAKNQERLADQKRADEEILMLREQALYEISKINADDRVKEQADLENQYNAELARLKEYLDKKLITITEYNNAVRDANAQNIKDNSAMQSKWQQEDFENAKQGFEGLSSLFSSYESENEGRRRKMFRAAKAFEIAAATMNAAGAISKAMNDWSAGNTWQRIALAGTVAATMGSLIASIQSTDYTPGRAQGGQFGAGTYMVGEKGPELVRFGGSGRIASNSDTNKLLSQSPNITIVNNTSAKIGNVEQQEMNNGDLVLIIQETLERETLQPNSRFNKALTRTRDTKRRV